MSQVPDGFGCINNTIKVSSGHYVDLRDPDPATIDIKSIAAALSKICRFGGHCPQFYSVAEHSFHATELAIRDGINGPAIRAVFMHDAAEAYIGDMVKPLKVMMPDYSETEHRIETAIQIAFGIDFVRWHDVIKYYDRAMLKAEKISMWPNDKEQWVGFSEINAAEISLRFWCPQESEKRFLAMAKHIFLLGASAV